ncbi:MAG: trigger factor [Chloroflexi bacterium]|nr:trigger factor [Chloroflexota bacterium]
MKVTTEKLPRSQVVLNIEVEPEVMEQSMQRAYRRVAGRTPVPGFRKGKAPRSIIERYLGRNVLVEEALNILIPEVYKQAIEEQQLTPVAQPDIDVVQTEPPVIKATISVQPTIELGDYKSLKLDFAVAEVTEEQVAESLAQMRKRFAPWEDVDRPVQEGDKLMINVNSVFTDGGPFINDDDVSYVVTPGLAFPIAGFSEQLEGIGLNETKDFTLTMPEDYPQEPFRGKEVAFKVTVKGIQVQQLPELDDAFAQSVNPEYATLDALRDFVRGQLEKDARAQARRKVEQEAVDALIAQATLEYPDVMVEHELDHIIEQYLPQGNRARLESYLQSVGRTREELREERRDEAVQRVVRSLVMTELTKAEEIEINEQDLTREVMMMLQSSTSQEEMNGLLQALNSAEAMSQVQRMAATRKTLGRLVEVVTGVPPEQDDVTNPAGMIAASDIMIEGEATEVENAEETAAEDAAEPSPESPANS